MAAEVTTGSTVGGWVLRDPIGAGASARVFLGDHPDHPVRGAVKILDPGSAARGGRETELLARIDHPNVAKVLDSDSAGNPAFVVTEFIDGTTLARLLDERGPIPTLRALQLFGQLSDALDTAHNAGVVHRDVAPSNVMVTNDDHLVLIDFGVGRQDDTATITADAAVLGTLRYVAPEIIEGRTPTPATDQYSSALILHEMLTGESPLGVTDNAANAMHQQLHAAPRPLTETDPTQSPAVEAALQRALSKDPADRFDSMQAFRRALSSGAHAGPAKPRLPRSAVVMLGVLLAALVATLVVVLQLLAPADDPVEEVTVGDDSTTTVDVPTTEVPTTEVPATEVPTIEVAPTEVPTSEPTSNVTTELATGVDPAWQATTADSLVCNLIEEAGFDNDVLVDNYYGGDSNPTPATIVDFGGVDDTPMIQVGESGLFGFYGQLIEIDPTLDYQVSAVLGFRGAVDEALIGVDWVDADFAPIEDARVARELTVDDARLVTFGPATPPPGAAHAVPFVFKSSSDGFLFADEMVFAPVGTCTDPRVDLDR